MGLSAHGTYINPQTHTPTHRSLTQFCVQFDHCLCPQTPNTSSPQAVWMCMCMCMYVYVYVYVDTHVLFISTYTICLALQRRYPSRNAVEQVHTLIHTYAYAYAYILYPICMYVYVCN